MQCRICDETPAKIVRNINRHLLAGKRSVHAIAKRYHVEPEDLQQHLQCIQAVPDEDNELLRSQRQLSALITQFQQDVMQGKQYEFDPEAGIDGRGVVTQMIATMREHRETILARKKLRSSDELYRDLRSDVVDPLINALTVIMVHEAKRLRDDLFDVTKDHDALQPRVKQAVDEMLKRAADRFSTDALHDLQEKVTAVISPKRKSAPQQH